MMSKVKIELDTSVVQEAILSKVGPAVEETLAAHYDIKQMIADELVKDYKPSDRERFSGYSGLMLHALGGCAEPRGKALIEALVQDAIRNAAKKFIDENVDDRREAIEGAFRKMMRDSADRMVNAFVDMIEGADLSLDLSATLAIQPPPRDYD